MIKEQGFIPSLHLFRLYKFSCNNFAMNCSLIFDFGTINKILTYWLISQEILDIIRVSDWGLGESAYEFNCLEFSYPGSAYDRLMLGL